MGTASHIDAALVEYQAARLAYLASLTGPEPRPTDATYAELVRTGILAAAALKAEREAKAAAS